MTIHNRIGGWWAGGWWADRRAHRAELAAHRARQQATFTDLHDQPDRLLLVSLRKPADRFRLRRDKAGTR